MLDKSVTVSEGQSQFVDAIQMYSVGTHVIPIHQIIGSSSEVASRAFFPEHVALMEASLRTMTRKDATWSVCLFGDDVPSHVSIWSTPPNAQIGEVVGKIDPSVFKNVHVKWMAIHGNHRRQVSS